MAAHCRAPGLGGHTLVLHGRRADALEAVAAELAALPGAANTPPRAVLADLARLEQVRTLAATVTGSGETLDVLVNNAGIGVGEPDGTGRRISPDGYELRFAVNYLAPALLSLLLAPSMGAEGSARIVNVASIGQAPLDFDDVMLEHGYSGSRAYGQSKLALIMFGFMLAERLPAGAVTVNSLHPGTYMPTKMVLQSVGRSIDSLQTGVESTRRLVLDPELDRTTGAFLTALLSPTPTPRPTTGPPVSNFGNSHATFWASPNSDQTQSGSALRHQPRFPPRATDPHTSVAS